MKKRSDGTTSQNAIPIQFSMSILGIFLLISAIFVIRSLSLKPENKKLNILEHVRKILYLDTQTSQYILKSGIPFLEQTSEEDDPVTFFHVNWTEKYWRLAANVKNASPLEILKTQIPFVALYKPKPQPIKKPELTRTPETQELPGPQQSSQPSENTPPELKGTPTVFIYHTHTSESYIPSSGKDHLLNQKGDIVKVGGYLQEVLEQKYHIQCAHSETIHDQYPFRDSYKRSHVTVVDFLKKYPGVQVVIDLHRDATPGLPNSCDIDGVKCATIAMIVGTDKMGLPHPHWRKNLEFAEEINDLMKLNYPGLSNGIIMSDARYNQHLHTHAILAEFGDQNSTLEEAYHAADRFAAIINMIINKDASGVTTLGGED